MTPIEGKIALVPTQGTCEQINKLAWMIEAPGFFNSTLLFTPSSCPNDIDPVFETVERDARPGKLALVGA